MAYFFIHNTCLLYNLQIHPRSTALAYIVMSHETISQAVAKVVFDKNRTFNNGKNYIWIRISRTKTTTLARYWRNKIGFHYMKIYLFNRKTRIVGEQIGFITHRVATNNIAPHLLWKK